MKIYEELFTKLMAPFFEGLLKIIKAIGSGLFQMFNILNYIQVIEKYKSHLHGWGLVICILAIVFLITILAIIIYLIVRAIKTYVRYRRNAKKEDQLIEEIEVLNNDNLKLQTQFNKLKELTNENGEIIYDEEGHIKNELKQGESRFFKLTKIDEEHSNSNSLKITNNFNLNQFCEDFRNYAASKLKLYYDIKIIRLFVASLASNKLIILEGISGTGKTSLAYAFGSFINNETTVASVQPSWRDSTEIFGYFNEFTKRFNETEILASIYEAQYEDEVFAILLDEMNISRVEYYFAEMLSVLELPNKEDWIVELVPNKWDNDPKKLDDGKLKIPENMWYIGTINNDDSTFMITDKVYDRAMPIAIDTKSEPFDSPEVPAQKVSFSYLNSLFKSASEKYAVSEEILNKIKEMDKYVIEHFRLAFGNRIVKQLKDFVPVYVACGGSELEGLDYLISHKILRKFEQLNLAYIKNEIDGFIMYLDNLFGKDTMKECQAYLLRLKKII